MEQDLNLLDYLKVILKWKKFIISFTGSVVILTVLACLVIPWTYRAETTLLVPSQTRGLEGLMALSSIVGGSTMNTPTNAPTEISQSMLGRTMNFMDILKSKTIASMIIEGLNLDKYYGARNKNDLISAIQKKLTVKEQKGLLKIYAQDRDPHLAADIANYSAIVLDEFNKKGNIQYARRFKNFIREQLAAAKIDLDDAEEKLKKFETQSQMVKMSEKELLSARLLRDVKVKEAIYTMLMQEYERSRIDEAKEELFFEVLDPAQPPKQPYFPKPFLYSIIAFVLGVSNGTFLAFFFEYLEKLGIKVPQIDYEWEVKWVTRKKR